VTRWVWAVLVVGLSCRGCHSGDGGRDAAPRASGPSVDLRTALTLVYPEYRDTAVLETRARVTRVIPTLTAERLDHSLKAMHYLSAADGGWQLSAFHLSQTDPHTVSVEVHYDVDQLSHLYVSATSLTSMELSMYLPRGLEASEEHFTFEVHYASAPARAEALVDQAVRLLLGNGQWAELLGDGGVEASARRVLVGVDGARISFERVGGQVWARYELSTLAP
jgi:hypothetical protein